VPYKLWQMTLGAELKLVEASVVAAAEVVGLVGVVAAASVVAWAGADSACVASGFAAGAAVVVASGVAVEAAAAVDGASAPSLDSSEIGKYVL